MPQSLVDYSGVPSAGNSPKVFFVFNDATPKTIITLDAGTTVFAARIIIQVPFNGPSVFLFTGNGSELILGDADQPDRLITTHQVSPLQVGEYETNPGFTYTAATPILLTIQPGSGCTQGEGFVILEI